MRVLCVLGPTASGKSAAALAIADAFAERGVAVELVSVDSAQVYHGLDVGTAKPDASERARVPHHGLDLCDPAEAYSAARFVADARRTLAEVRGRGALPVLVGGTLLYVKALFEGLAAMPEADPAVRAVLEREAAAAGWPAMHAELSRVDPVTAARLAPNDAQRIQRALEVFRVSGQPISAWHAAADTQPAVDALEPLHVSLEPRSRAWLHARIAERFRRMLADGLVDEVRRLRTRGDLAPGLPALRSVGYRQAWAAIDAAEATGRPLDLGALESAGVAATRRLAKRQLTWLRSMPERHVVAADDPAAQAQVVALASRLLGA